MCDVILKRHSIRSRPLPVEHFRANPWRLLWWRYPLYGNIIAGWQYVSACLLVDEEISGMWCVSRRSIVGTSYEWNAIRYWAIGDVVPLAEIDNLSVLHMIGRRY